MDVFSLAATIVALIVLFYFKMGILRLIGCFALAGIAHHLILT
jgi:hypothetical protein